jgi:CelD/BcsL family acetyltransferase involved in cellulose biosynthesis
MILSDAEEIPFCLGSILFDNLLVMILESVPIDGMSPALLGEIQDFLDSQDTGHPFQFPQWAGPGSKVVLVRTDGRICWLGTFGVQKPLGRRFPWLRALTANRGPVCDDRQLWDTAAEELAASMREQSFAFLDVLPEWIRQADGDHPNFANNFDWHSIGKPRTSLRLDVTSPEEEIFANFRKATRYEIRRAERLGATVTAASSDREIDEFLDIYQRMAVQKGFIPNPIDNLRRVVRWLIASESRGTLLIGRAGGVALGGAIIARSGRRCWYILGANDREEGLTVGHILQWKAILWAKSHGCTEYDFGGYTPGATSGPAWFKEGFGGTVVDLVGAHRRMIERKRYNIFRAISGISNWM